MPHKTIIRQVNKTLLQMEHGQRMVPWLVIVAFLALHICALSPLSPWGTPTRVTLYRPLSRLHYSNDKGPLIEQEHQEKKSHPLWGDIFNKFRKALTTLEAKDVVATAKEDIELDYEKEESVMKNDINATVEQTFSFSPELQHFHFSPSLQQILREMKIRAEKDMTIVGTFFRGEDGGIGADKAIRIVYRGDREMKGAEEVS